MNVYVMNGICKETNIRSSVQVGGCSLAQAYDLMRMTHYRVVCLFEQTKKGWVPHARLIRREKSHHETPTN